MFAVYYYRIYETKKEIDLGVLERELPMAHTPSRTRFIRLRPQSILVDTPPLQIALGKIQVKSGEMLGCFNVLTRVYDIGAISICFIYEVLDHSNEQLEDVALAFAGQKLLGEHFDHQLATLQLLLQPALGFLDVNPDFYEDYTIYRILDPRQVNDPVSLLMGEKVSFSIQLREQIMQNRLSYSTDDYVILTWDSALICDQEDPSDLRDLIEFANVQLLELRYYDNLLSKQVETMYDDIEMATTRTSFSRLRRYRRILGDLMGFIADITEVTEKIANLIKITEDIYYARVYKTTLAVLRVDQWRDSVNRKMRVIQQNYSLLSNQVNVQHSNVLEWIIIILIALEFGFALWNS